MLSYLDTLITSAEATSISMGGFMLCVIAALLFGLVISATFQYKNTVSKSFAVTLALLPPIVSVVIMMVNGSIGTGIAVAGAFSLIRFRSVPGTGREIAAVFLAMAVGLTAGMGYLGYGLIFTIFICIVNLVLENTCFGQRKTDELQKTLRITIPENLNYAEVFDDIFEEYTTEYKLTQVKTSNMGSLFKLSYDITLKNSEGEKDFIDKLRTRNGNLEISSSIQSIGGDTL